MINLEIFLETMNIDEIALNTFLLLHMDSFTSLSVLLSLLLMKACNTLNLI
jgi:hypothetical protein